MFSAELEPHTQNLVPHRSMVEHFVPMELSDLLDSDMLEYCKHMTDANTSEGDQSLDELMLAAYDSICEPWQQHPPTNMGA